MRNETMFRHPIQPYRIKGKVITTTHNNGCCVLLFLFCNACYAGSHDGNIGTN